MTQVVIIRGNRNEAQDAAELRGVQFTFKRESSRGGQVDSVGYVHDDQVALLQAWDREAVNLPSRDAGFVWPVGTLLSYEAVRS